MKQFFITLFAVLAALLVAALLGLVALFGLVGVLASLGKEKHPVPDRCYLVVDVSGTIADAPPEMEGGNLFEQLGGGGYRTQLWPATRALRAAATDSRIAGVYLTGNLVADGTATGWAAVKELRDALAAFRAAGKPILAYNEFAFNRDYYLMSVADEVVVHPQGLLHFSGIAASPMFLGGALERYGVGIQVVRAGDYKDAAETLVRRDFSPESRAQLELLLGSIWSSVRGDVAAARGMSPEEVQAVAADGVMLRGSDAVERKLADRTAHIDEVLDELRRRTGVDSPKEPFRQISLKDYIAATGAGPKPGDRRRKVAVVYAEGEILDSSAEHGFVGGLAFSRELRRLRNDETVKAVVLRVNSPGGSATASELIRRELALLKEKKPVVVSMGSVAASGGYWVATAADRVFAQEATITGSIGVIGTLANFRDLAGRFGITFDTVKTAPSADVFSIGRPKTPAELAAFQRMIDGTYADFIDRVVEARGLDRAKVMELAGGRVWSGADAHRLGLVDEIGGLDRAIAFAAEKAALGDSYRVVEWPRTKPLAEAIQSLLGGKPSEQAQGGVAGALQRALAREWRALRSFDDPRGAYARLPYDLTLE